MSKFEFPIFISPENALMATVNHIQNKLFDHSEAAFQVILNNITGRIVTIDKVEFRVNQMAMKSGVLSKTDGHKNSTLTKSQIGTLKIFVKHILPEIENFNLLKNESLAVLLSLAKDMNLFVC